jgi:hypothetical protein
MDNVILFGGIVAGIVVVVSAAITYGLYGGVPTALVAAKPGQVYNFTYCQPHTGEPARYLARVLMVRQMSESDIWHLNSNSQYRKYDASFLRTANLVTCQTADGKLRSFYAERTVNCRRPLLAYALFKLGVAAAA